MSHATETIKKEKPKGMKVKDLVSQLKLCDQNAEILLASDEELNRLYRRMEVNKLSDRKKSCVLFGYSGTELEEPEY